MLHERLFRSKITVDFSIFATFPLLSQAKRCGMKCMYTKDKSRAKVVAQERQPYPIYKLESSQK